MTVTSFISKGLGALRRTANLSRRSATLMVAIAFSATVIASPPPKPSVTSGPTSALYAHHWFQVGKASWYGRAFQGKRTATGERFDMNALTCAHRTLPLGSWLRVTNLRNHKSTFVRVNDRGPYEPNTILDLSYAAAQKLGVLGKAQVRVERIQPNDPQLAEALMPHITEPDIPLSVAR